MIASVALTSGPLAQRPKILHLLHSSAIGGGPVSVRLLASGMRPEFEPVVVSSGEGELPRQLAIDGIEFHALPLTSKWSFLLRTGALARLIRGVRPDLVHLHGHWAGSIGELAVVLAGRPRTVYTVRWPAYSSDRGLYTRVRNWLVERFSCAMAGRVVAISEYDRNTLVDRRICAAAKLTMIHNAVAFLPPARLPREPGNGRVTVGFVGRLVEQKGCDELIAAFQLLGEERDRARLLVVGDGPLRPGLEGQARSAGLAGQVEFLGFRTDAAQLMADMDIVAVPSRFEPFGMVAVEAMANELPVVASAVGGLTETVQDGVTGRLVASGDVRAMADALAELIRAPQLRAEMGRAGRARVVDFFSPERVIADYSRLYRDVLAR